MSFPGECNICGNSVGGGKDQWLNEFRILFYRKDQWFVPHLSGVGIRRPYRGRPHTVAPLDTNRRYDDIDYEKGNAAEVTIESMGPWFPTHYGRGDFDNGLPWGYIFHEACWRLLNAVYYPAKIDLRVFLRFCLSFPLGQRLVDWGHGYGGILEPQTDIPPRPSRTLGRSSRIRRRLGTDSHPWDITFDSDPLILPREVEHLLLQETTETNSNIYNLADDVRRVSLIKTRKDCFAMLPTELRDTILFQLPSRDVRSLFLASRVFAGSQISKMFWASRFRPGLEFAFIYEQAREQFTSPRDWKSLYFAVSECLIQSPNLRNRKRIWELLEPLVDAMILISQNALHGTPRGTFFDPELSQDDLLWRHASCLVIPPMNVFHYGSQTLFSRTTKIPGVVTGVYVSMVHNIAGVSYVAGLRFIDGEGASYNLGYVLPKNEIYIKEPKTTANENPGIHAFQLANGMRGIHALAVVTASGKISPWAGSPCGIPRGCLISRAGAIRDIKGDFDVSGPIVILACCLSTKFYLCEKGLKLLTLGIPNEGKGEKSSEFVSLREMYSWSPDIPPQSLCLNAGQFLAIDPVKPGVYNPLFWIHFGGFQGNYLSNITSLSFWILNGDLCTGMEIGYNQEIGGTAALTLGFCGPLSQEQKRTFGAEGSAMEERVAFNIDGPGGEYITAVRVGMDAGEEYCPKLIEVRCSYLMHSDLRPLSSSLLLFIFTSISNLIYISLSRLGPTVDGLLPFRTRARRVIFG